MCKSIAGCDCKISMQYPFRNIFHPVMELEMTAVLQRFLPLHLKNICLQCFYFKVLQTLFTVVGLYHLINHCSSWLMSQAWVNGMNDQL